MKFLVLIAKNVGRNPLRSILTALGTMVLVLVVTMVWSILAFLDQLTVAKDKDFKAIVSERWSIPSRMPLAYSASLAEGAARQPGDARPLDSMTWQFFAGTTTPDKISRETIVFTLAGDPKKFATMMEGLDNLAGDEKAQLDESLRRLEANQQGVILGQNHLKALNKQIGQRIKLFGFGTFKGLDFEFEIVGAFPPGRYDALAGMNRDYFNNQLDTYPSRNNGRVHPMAERSLSLVWLKLADAEHFNKVAAQIESSPLYRSPAIKCETASSGTGTFLEAFRDLIWGMRWLLAPSCLITLSLVISNAISISIRERRIELAVLKVLGFQPRQILILVLGESLLLGTIAGLASAVLTYTTINWWFGGIKFPLAFFGTFFIPVEAIGWGTAIGALAALAGSFLPAWNARNVQVAEVFSKVA